MMQNQAFTLFFKVNQVCTNPIPRDRLESMLSVNIYFVLDFFCDPAGSTKN